jgi:hypothetical protein
MWRSGASLSRTVNDGSQPNDTSSTRKPYEPPEFAVLTPEQAAAKLEDKGVPESQEKDGPALKQCLLRNQNKNRSSQHTWRLIPE